MTRFVTVHDASLSMWLSAVQDVARQSYAASGANASIAKMNSTKVLHHPMMQAAMSHAQRATSAKAILNPDLSFDGNQLAHISHLAFIFANAKIHQLESLAEESEEKLFRLYSSRDPDWLKCIATYTEYYGRGEKPQYHNWKVEGNHDLNYSVISHRLKNNARVGIIGDWGTGMEDARKLLEAMLDLNVDAVIHLGDVYYSGTDWEFQHHIVDAFEQAFAHSGKRVPVFSIPGNHDYYSGGKGFYEKALSLNNSPQLEQGWQQEASYFCLRTEDDTWQFLGMDTGLNGRYLLHYPPLAPVTPYLEDSEIEWHQDKLKNFTGTTILLSHHQLFSQHIKLEDQPNESWLNHNLLTTFDSFFDRIAIWFWGHEHNLVLFQDGLFNLEKGRLIGCSAYEQTGDPYAPLDKSFAKHVPYIQTQTQWKVSPSTEDPAYYNHAFAILDFARKTQSSPIRCSYYMFPSWGEHPPAGCQPRELYSEDIYKVNPSQIRK